LESVALWERVVNHPKRGMEAPIKYFHIWLAQIARDDTIVIDSTNKRYRHPKNTGLS
jgi:hypothetical protein